MGVAKYPDRKISGVDWLGEIPSHWTVKELKYVCTNKSSNVDKKSVDAQEPVFLCNYTDVYYNDKITSDLSFMQATATEEQIEKFTLRAGDVIITKDSESADDIAISTYVPEDLPGVLCGYHLAIIRPNKDVCGLFVKQLFDSIYIKSKVAILANGLTRVGLGHSAVGGLELPIPPDKKEQKTIATFLDTETSKIDALIAEQRRLIELLKEKRQAVISHAVTKGLNPDVKMKDSGVEWLGEVPEHWEVKAFQRCVSITEGQVDPKQTEFSDMVLIAPNHIQSGTGQLLKLENSDEQGAISGKYFCKAGDVIYSKIRPALRKVCIAPEDCLCSADMYPLHAHSGLTNEFLFRWILTEQFSTFAVLESDRVAMPKINRESLKRVKFVIPPEDEQVEICEYIESQTIGFDTLVAQAEHSISLLQERRTALISAAVTGKIDVRDYAIKGAA